MRPHPLSLRQVLDMMTPWRTARFIYNELPIRYAERIRLIESIEAWDCIPDLVDVHNRHMRTFEQITSEKFPNKSSLSDPDLLHDFNDVVHNAALLQQNVQQLVARAMHRLYSRDRVPLTFINMWLDDFLLNWIGTEMLLSHYLACIHGHPTGIVNPTCDVSQVCRQVAFNIQLLCQDLLGRVPQVHVLSRSALDEDRRAPSFSYIPSFLTYILTEILKNSCRATLESTPDELKLLKRPITVLVCADERRVAIRVNDLARGIPFDVGEKIWSYMYSTARKAGTTDDEDGATPLAGYGVGLPLSRLYARYLGGSLDLVSWPGYGTDVHLFLPRLSAEQVEVVPDQDNDEAWTRQRVSRLLSSVEETSSSQELSKFVDWVFDNGKKE